MILHSLPSSPAPAARAPARQSGFRRAARHLLAGAGALALPVLAACTDLGSESSGDEITIGAILPFTGKESGIGANLEQAMILAVEDVNRAGGVDGRKLRLETRDSNSGSERGLNELLELLYTEQVNVLVGPEEYELATSIVPDVKGLDVLNIHPSFTSPPNRRVVSRGAWLRLPPTPLALGCGMGQYAAGAGVLSVNAIVALDDFNQQLATEFQSAFSEEGGRLLPSVTVPAGRNSYADPMRQVLSYGADVTLITAYPAMASTIVTEWAISRSQGRWFLSPMLETDAFLRNIPSGVLDGTEGISPTLSLRSECTLDPEQRGPVECSRDNARAFRRHFARRWGGNQPFPVAHFYYDAIVLYALGAQYAQAQHGSEPTAIQLQDAVIELSQSTDDPARWDSLGSALPDLAAGAARPYRGAAAEYSFDRYGSAQHFLFDVWTIEQHDHVHKGVVWADVGERDP